MRSFFFFSFLYVRDAFNIPPVKRSRTQPMRAHYTGLPFPLKAGSRTGRCSPSWPKGPHGRLASLLLSFHFHSASPPRFGSLRSPQATKPSLPEAAARRREAERALSGNWVAFPTFAGHGDRNAAMWFHWCGSLFPFCYYALVFVNDACLGSCFSYWSASHC